MRNRFISLFLVVVICMSSFVTALAFDEPFESGVYGEEIQLMNALGVSTEGFEGANNSMYLTRAEFVVLTMQLLGYNVGDLTAEGQKFKDIPSDHWAYNYIMYAVKSGLFKGTETDKFDPDANVTFEQAVSIAVKMINYDVIAETRGGYPFGYLNVAYEKNLLDGFNNPAFSDAITREQAYVLLYNTAHADILKNTAYGERIDFTVESGKSILTEYRKIYYIDGVITADNVYAIEGVPTKEENVFYVGNYEFTDKSGTAKDKVGYKVRVYYYESDRATQRDAIAVYNLKNKVIQLTPENIKNFDYANGIYEVYEGDKIVKIELGDSYSLIYNFEYIDGSEKELMLPKAGTITLIDNDKDEIYDIVKVEEYYNTVFSSYDPYTNTVIDNALAPQTNEMDRNICLDDYKTILGDEIDFEKLSTGMVVSVIKSRNNKIIKFLYSGIKFNGTITQITQGNAGTVYVIDDKEYSLARDLRFNTQLLTVGRSLSLFLDGYGHIAYADLDMTSRGGYVVKFSTDNTGLDETKLMMYLPTGVLSIFTVADKVQIEKPEGRISVTADKLEQEFTTFLPTSRFYVLYETNSKGELSKMIFPKLISTEQEFDNMGTYPLYKMDYFIENWPSTCSVYYKDRNRAFGNWLALSDGATVFCVPEETNTDIDEENFYIGEFYEGDHVNVVKSNSGQKAKDEVDVYKYNGESGAADVVISFGNSLGNAIRDDEYGVGIVNELYEKYNTETMDAEVCIDYFEGGIRYTGVIESKDIIERQGLESVSYSNDIGTPTLHDNKTRLAIGDIFKYSKNSNGKITSICLLYDSENDKLSFNALTTPDRIFRLVNGEVKYISNNYLEMDIPDKIDTTGITLERTRIDWCPVIVVDKVKEEVTVGSNSDIKPGDKILTASRYYLNNLIVLYKGEN